MCCDNFLNNYKHEGESLKIEIWPSPALSKKTQKVESFDDDLKCIIKNMLFTMYSTPGIGLAAPQVNVNKRFFVLDIDYKREKVTLPDNTEEYHLDEFNPMVFINPVIKSKKGEILYEEGCLSIPGVYEEVKRAEEISVEFQDIHGNQQQLDTDGILAVCIQHECDHLNGIVFLDRLSLLKRKFIKKKFLKERQRDRDE